MKFRNLTLTQENAVVVAESMINDGWGELTCDYMYIDYLN